MNANEPAFPSPYDGTTGMTKLELLAMVFTAASMTCDTEDNTTPVEGHLNWGFKAAHAFIERANQP